MRVPVLAFVFSLCALTAAAFEETEHQLLSDIALKAALKEESPLKMDARFGLITAAVDWYPAPDRLLSRHTVDQALKEPGWFAKGRAARRNDDHFQRAALEAWWRHHKNALDAARNGQYETALLSEAVSLHYLQDFFSAGHVVTPRAGLHDAAAGHLHDTYNRTGVEFRLRPPEGTAGAALEALVGPELLTADEREQFDKAVAADKPRFRGDGALIAKSREYRHQKVWAALASTLSIREVVRAANKQSDEEIVQTCFSRRGTDPKTKKLYGPKGALRLARATERVIDCDDGPWLGRYLTDQDPALQLEQYPLSGVHLRGEVGIGRRDQDLRVNLDALFFMWADPPKGDIEGAEAQPGLLEAATAGFTFSHGGKYNAVGVMFDYNHPTPVDAVKWGWRLSLRRYGYGDTHPWRTDLGIKGALSLDVVSLIAVLERSHHIAESGEFRAEYFVFVGGEIFVPWSWVGRALEYIF